MEEEVKEFLMDNAMIILAIAVLLFFVGVAVGKMAPKNVAPAEQKYLNGTFYLKYPPDPYPNFPGGAL